MRLTPKFLLNKLALLTRLENWLQANILEKQMLGLEILKIMSLISRQ